MTIKFEKIKPGMTLYDRHQYAMGNTTMRTIGEWKVQILSVDEATQSADVVWNSNAPRCWERNRLEKLSTWSMHDPDVEVRKGLMGRIVSVKRKTGGKP